MKNLTGPIPRFSFTDLLSCLVAAGLALGAMTLAANQVLTSNIYQKSRFISLIVSHDDITLADVVGNTQNVGMLLKFAGAITSAYINFELIPVNEASTFVAVLESNPGLVEIEKFEYHRKNLTITGSAATQQDYGTFLTRLRDTEHFASVAGHYYITTENTVRFEVECSPPANGTFLDFD